MPELPEVESVRQCLLQQPLPLPGSVVIAVDIKRASVVDGISPEQFASRLTGAVFNEVLRHGKYLFFRFSQQRVTKTCWMALHLRMTGRLYLSTVLDSISGHTRFAIYLDNDRMLRFDDPRAFGRVWLLDDPDQVIAALGPDALSADRQYFMDRLANSRRQLKPLLLDQSFVAGIGNIYADEALFRARVNPLRTADSLDAKQRDSLFVAVHNVLEQAVACKGANIDGVFEAGHFPVAVYGRAGKACPVCGDLVVKIRVAQRGTHICRSCQPML